jgi:hypothetical protein
MTMSLTIYEVISGGTKKYHAGAGVDWCVLVAANSPTEARDIAYYETEIDRPWVIYEWGTDARESAEPGILRGPYEHCPAVNRGWKQYQEDFRDNSDSPAIIEWE